MFRRIEELEVLVLSKLDFQLQEFHGHPCDKTLDAVDLKKEISSRDFGQNSLPRSRRGNRICGNDPYQPSESP